MSLLPIGTAITLAVDLGILSPVFLFTRNIGGFVADATLHEAHRDELGISLHPVEQGAEVTDHSYKKPASVIIRAVFSNASYQALGDPSFINSMYENFLALQSSRQPFDVLTTKRAYTNMLMPMLTTDTDERTENILSITCECREMIFVETQTITVPPNDKMATPQVNGATSSLGTKNLVPASGFDAGAAGLQ